MAIAALPAHALNFICREKRIALSPELRGLIEEGTPVDRFDDFPDHEVSLLGAGNTADVFRLELGEERIRQIKVFKDYKRDYDRDIGWQIFFPAAELARRNKNIHSILRNLSNEGKLAGHFRFPDVKNLRVNKGGQVREALEFTPIIGKNLLAIFNGPNIPPETKTRLYEQFVRSLSELAVSLNAVPTYPALAPEFNGRLTNFNLPYLECPVFYRGVNETLDTRLRIAADGIIYEPFTKTLHVYDAD